jgi:hypothetical protein
MLSSGSSGWNPNIVRYYTTDKLYGKWCYHGNPCSGYNKIDELGIDKSYGGQSSFIIEVQGKEDSYISMFDIWRPEQPIKGRYIWLPIIFVDDLISIKWLDAWGLEVFDEMQ